MRKPMKYNKIYIHISENVDALQETLNENIKQMNDEKWEVSKVKIKAIDKKSKFVKYLGEILYKRIEYENDL